MWSLAALVIGFCIDLLVGDPHGFPHPVVLIGKCISVLERGLRCICPKTPSGERAAGAILWGAVVIVHGGVYAAMMDHVAGTAACSRGSTCRTVNYDLHYLAPAQPGLLRCRAESVRMGQQIVVMQVWVEDAQGVRCAEGCYTFRCKPAEHKD